MSHYITAVIGHRDAIERLLGSPAGGVAYIELTPTLVIAPLGETQIDRLTKLQPGAYREGFTYLSEALEATLHAAAETYPIAYIETHYSGGEGDQGAAVFGNDGLIMAPALSAGEQRSRSSDPINSALRAIGVQARNGCDEFDTVGLGQFRSMATLGITED
ncbi:hypothetical protein [Rhizobium sp.]